MGKTCIFLIKLILANFSRPKSSALKIIKKGHYGSLLLYFGSLLLSYHLKHPNISEKTRISEHFNFGQFWPAEIDKKASRPAGWSTGLPVKISNPELKRLLWEKVQRFGWFYWGESNVYDGPNGRCIGHCGRQRIAARGIIYI